MIDVVIVVEASLYLTPDLKRVAHENVVDVNVGFAMNVGAIHFPNVNMVNVSHARDSFHCSQSNYLIITRLRKSLLFG